MKRRNKKKNLPKRIAKIIAKILSVILGLAIVVIVIPSLIGKISDGEKADKSKITHIISAVNHFIKTPSKLFTYSIIDSSEIGKSTSFTFIPLAEV